MNHPRWLAVLLVWGSLGLVGCEKVTPATLPKIPTEVVITDATVRQVNDYEEFTGRTDAILSVQITARVTGYLDKKDFQDGQEVHEGDILYEIDDRPYKTMLVRAESMVAQGEAHRARLEAEYRRAANLFQRATIGKQEFDLISSNFAEAEAQLGASKAQLEVARLNMSFTKVRAPMDGQLSRTLVDPGNLIRQDDTILNDIVWTDKLYVYFDLNEDAIRRVQGLFDQGRVESGTGKEVPVQVGLSDEDVFPYKGVVNFSENKLDAATGTLRVRGIIDNPRPWTLSLDLAERICPWIFAPGLAARARSWLMGPSPIARLRAWVTTPDLESKLGSRILSPGLFVRVRLPIGAPHPAVLIRDEAVSSDQGRSFVYVIDPDDMVEYRPVETGVTHEGFREIRKGLKAGERVIGDANGIQRVRPGSKVAPRTTPPKSSPPKSPSKTA